MNQKPKNKCINASKTAQVFKGHLQNKRTRWTYIVHIKIQNDNKRSNVSNVSKYNRANYRLHERSVLHNIIPDLGYYKVWNIQSQQFGLGWNG